MSATLAPDVESPPVDQADPSASATAESHVEPALPVPPQSDGGHPSASAAAPQDRPREIAPVPAGTDRPQQGAATLALSQAERDQAAARIRNLTTLPPALRDCLAKVVESGGTAAEGSLHVPIDQAVRAIEEALPDFVRLDRSRINQPRHPDGEAFFRGDAADLSEAEAEEIARQQLARSGLLRGQGVRAGN